MSTGQLNQTEVPVTKLAAAQRQLQTAVRLWFRDGDPIAIHTLVFASYEILTSLAKARGLNGLFYESIPLEGSARSTFLRSFRASANFFKHADRDPEGLHNSPLILNDMLLLLCVDALHRLKEELSVEAQALKLWMSVHRVSWLTDDIVALLPLKLLDSLNEVSKQDFLSTFEAALN